MIQKIICDKRTQINKIKFERIEITADVTEI